MRIDTQLIRILLFSFPGIIAFFIYSAIVGRKSNRTELDFLLIFMFSMVPYVFLDAVGRHGSVDVWLRAFDSANGDMTIDGQLILWATVIGVAIAIIVAAVQQKRLINKLACKIKVTKRNGNIPIWDIYHDENNGWNIVRDLKLDLIYTGYFHGFSQDTAMKELIIRDVTVYNDSGERLYEVSELYLCRQPEDIMIETWKKGADENEQTTAATISTSTQANPISTCD